MNLKAYKTIAWIYGLYFLISAIIAFAFFKYLESNAEASGSILGIDIKAGGAIGGFLVIFLALHYVFKDFVFKAHDLHLSGNVRDHENRPIEHASVSIDGEKGDINTDANGRFLIDVKSRASWTLFVSKKDYESREIHIDAKQIDEPLRIVLKKKL